MRFLKEKLNLRIYQQTILNTAKSYNTLCVLPTGLGKTYIAVALAGLLLNENKKILILAPTKPLVNQHKQLFSEFFEGEKEDFAVFTGEVPPHKRTILWQRAKIIFSTPQTIKHDILNEKISLDEVSLIVFDEAHRAVGKYPYSFIAKEFGKRGRILALTASPGTDREKIKEICSNLLIEKIEVRDRKHPEVRPFIKPIEIEFEFVELPEKLLRIKKHLEIAIRERLQILKKMGIIESADLRSYTKTELLNLQAKLRSQLSEESFEIMRALSLVASIIKIQHALNLLESESLDSLITYFKQIWEKSKSTKTKAVQDIINDFHVRVSYQLALEIKEEGFEHPKIKVLKKVVSEQMRKKDSKILIFTEFRSNIPLILEALKDYKVARFVGQASSSGKGMAQKEQLEVIEKLRRGEVNILVCTSVAEEGLDIPAVDLVIFYAPIPSAIRSIQRRGRTGRQKVGKLVVLITKGTKDEAYYWVSYHKERKMIATLKEFSEEKLQIKPLQEYFEKENESNSVKLFVDFREEEVGELLRNLGAKIEFKNLEVGDFLISNEVVVERKTTSDFVASLIDKRLFNQALELKRNFEKPIFILEGNLDNLYSRAVQQNAIRGAIISLIVDYKIPILISSSPKETAEYLFLLAKREQLELKKEVSLRGARKEWSISKQQQFLIEGLPYVGPNLAKALLKRFGSPQKIANAKKEELMSVDKIGEKKAEIIKRIFEEQYIEEE